jgi:Putative zinc-finger
VHSRNGDDCARVRAHISEQLDGDLSEVEAAALAAHVDDCAPCRSFAVGLDAMSRLLGSAAPEQPTDAIAVPARRIVGVRSMQLAAAAAAVVASAGVTSIHAVAKGHKAFPARVGFAASSSSAPRSRRPTYRDSVDYEQRLIAEARATYKSARTGGVVHE